MIGGRLAGAYGPGVHAGAMRTCGSGLPGCWGRAVALARGASQHAHTSACASFGGTVSGGFKAGTPAAAGGWAQPRTVALPGKQLANPAESQLHLVRPVAGSQSKLILPARGARLRTLMGPLLAAASNAGSPACRTGTAGHDVPQSTPGQGSSCRRRPSHLYSWRIHTAAWPLCSRTATAPCQLLRCAGGRPAPAHLVLRRCTA